MSEVKKYWKTIIAVIGIVAGYLYTYNVAHPNHWVGVVIGVLTALGVYTVKNG